MDAGGRGSGAHSLDEWYEDGDRGWLGPQWIAVTITSLAGVRATRTTELRSRPTRPRAAEG